MKNKNILGILMLFISNFGVGILSYAYHPLMIKYLDLKEFGEFESLLSLLNISVIITLSISLFLVKEFAKDKGGEKSRGIVNISFKNLTKLGLGLFGVFLLLSPLIQNFLHIDNFWIIFLTLLIIPLTFSGLYQGAFLQGKKEFKVISYTNLINPIVKLLIGFILVILGFKVYGAIGGFILGVLIYLIVRYIIVENKLKKYPKNLSEKSLEKEIISDFKSQKFQIFQFFLSSIVLAILMNIDILFAKHLFEPEIAGTYAGISIIAKFLVFVGMSIETVYYPVLTEKDSIDKKKVFLLSSLYFIMTVGAIGFFYLFGEKILHLFKPGFEKYLDLLYLIIIYCGALALLNFFVKILIAFNKYLLNYILVFLIIIFIFLVKIYGGDSMYNLINIFNILIGISLVSSFLYLGFVRNEK